MAVSLIKRYRVAVAAFPMGRVLRSFDHHIVPFCILHASLLTKKAKNNSASKYINP